MTPQNISAGFLFESRYIDVHGSKMHYIDEGEGDPILFLHGNPTSSYLWRNIIPHMTGLGRCIAPDLIGMGQSDQPDLDYRFVDHVKYLEGFIGSLALKDITLVIHDWGSALGFHYAMRHQDNVKGIAFMEAILKPQTWAGFNPQYKRAFKLLRAPVTGWLMTRVLNVFIKRLLPQTIVWELSAEEMAYYAAPFKTIKSRKPLQLWPAEIPIDGKPADVHQAVADYQQELQASELPKLLLYAQPGGIIKKDAVDWCRQNLNKLTVKDIGKGIHFIQEDQPQAIGTALADWYRGL